MSESWDQTLPERPKRRLFRGQAVTETYALGIASKDGEGEGDRSRRVQVLSSRGVGFFRPGYCAYILEMSDLPHEARHHVASNSIPCITNARAVDDISSGDIVEVNGRVGRARIVQFADSDDYSVLLTNRCNSNCVMCPDSEHTRREGCDVPLDWIAMYLALLERDTWHLSLTGGEPTLLGDDLFTVLDMCKQSLPHAQLLLLTNGRMFYYKDYARQLALHGGRRIIVATTLHCATAEAHDRITGVPGSFEQTLLGIRNLRACGTRVEVRVVIQQANCHHLHDLAALIASQVPSPVQVSFMGLEMLGNAAKNRDSVWVDPREVSPELSRAIRHLLQQGIASRIYNLPLCTVDPAYWSLCAKSISDYKRTYKPECARCTIRDHCGGLFGTALNHRLTRVRPIEGSCVTA